MPLLSLFSRATDLRRRAATIYSQLVAQARHPWFYTAAGVPDTLDGRFEMIVLHLWALQKQLKAEVANSDLQSEQVRGAKRQGERSDGGKAPLAQLIMEIAFDDLDRSLRELGVGDMGVARRIRAMADGIYGRFEAYDRAAGDPQELAEALRRNVYGTISPATQQTDLLLKYANLLNLSPSAPDALWPTPPDFSSH